MKRGVGGELVASGRSTRPVLLETFDRLLRAATHAATVARRTGDPEVREWTALAALDAIDLGEQLGMLHDAEAERQREEMRAAIDDLERS